MRIKVLSLNIACFIPWKDKHTLLKKIVDQENPDVLCLQEVARNLFEDSEEHNQIQKVAELFKTDQYHGNLCNPYIVTEEYRKNDSCYHGCATYVLNPEIKLASHSDVPVNSSNNRFVIESTLSYKNREFKVINLHLEAKDRKEEARLLLGHLHREGSQKIIVCGDLNSFDARDREDVDSDLRKTLDDAWGELEEGLAVTSYGSEWWYNNLPKHPHTIKIKSRDSSYPDGNLDYFFCKNVKPLKIKTLSEPVPYLSDHLGLVAEFEV